MNSEPYNEWISLYSTDAESIWYSQCKELRNAAMLLKVLDVEFKRIYKDAEEKLKFCEEIVNTKSDVTLKKDYSVDEKENISLKGSNYNNSEIFMHNSLSESPLLSKASTTNDSVLIPSQDNYCTSPKMNRANKISRLKRIRQNRENYLKLNQVTPKKYQKVVDIIDSTIIETTPPSNENKNISKTTKYKPKSISSASSPMVSNISSSTKNIDNYTAFEITKRTKTTTTANQNFNETMENKAKIKPEGWDCSECKAFYEALDLDSQCAKKLLNKCSRHRNNVQPCNYSPKGFWDLNFPLTQPSEKNASDSTYFQY